MRQIPLLVLFVCTVVKAKRHRRPCEGFFWSNSTLVGYLNWSAASVAAGNNLLTKIGSGPLVSGNHEVAFAGAGNNLSGYTFDLLAASPAVAATPEPAELRLLPLALPASFSRADSTANQQSANQQSKE